MVRKCFPKTGNYSTSSAMENGLRSRRWPIPIPGELPERPYCTPGRVFEVCECKNGSSTHPGRRGLIRGRVFVIPGIAEVVLALPLPIVVAVVGFVVVVEVFGPVPFGGFFVEECHNVVVLLG